MLYWLTRFWVLYVCFRRARMVTQLYLNRLFGKIVLFIEWNNQNTKLGKEIRVVTLKNSQSKIEKDDSKFHNFPRVLMLSTVGSLWWTSIKSVFLASYISIFSWLRAYFSSYSALINIVVLLITVILTLTPLLS